MVLTLNQFGSIAINMSMILEKSPAQPYPWVCNLHDLENIIEIIQYMKILQNQLLYIQKKMLNIDIRVMLKKQIKAFS